MKKSILCVGALCMGLWASAENIEVKSFRYAGPYAVHQPYMIDTVDVNSKAFTMKKFLDIPLSFELLKVGTSFSGEVLPATEGHALHLLEFTLQNTSYAKVKFNIEGLKNYQLYVDGKKQNGAELALEPSTHPVVIKYFPFGERFTPEKRVPCNTSSNV